MGNFVLANQAEELTIKILQIKEFSCHVQTSGKLNSSIELLGTRYVYSILTFSSAICLNSQGGSDSTPNYREGRETGQGHITRSILTTVRL